MYSLCIAYVCVSSCCSSDVKIATPTVLSAVGRSAICRSVSDGFLVAPSIISVGTRLSVCRGGKSASHRWCKLAAIHDRTHRDTPCSHIPFNTHCCSRHTSTHTQAHTHIQPHTHTYNPTHTLTTLLYIYCINGGSYKPTHTHTYNGSHSL